MTAKPAEFPFETQEEMKKFLSDAKALIAAAPTQAEEVVQNVRTLLATAPGTVPLARALGVPQDMVDLPQSAAAARLQAAGGRRVGHDLVIGFQDDGPRVKRRVGQRVALAQRIQLQVASLRRRSVDREVVPRGLEGDREGAVRGGGSPRVLEVVEEGAFWLLFF